MRTRSGSGIACEVGALCIAVLSPALSTPRVVVNGKTVRGVPAYLSGTHLMVPVRSVVEQIPGAGVEWDARSKQVWVRRGNVRVKLNVGSGYAHVNREAIPLDAPVAVRGQRALIPASFVSEVLGAQVEWNAGQVARITAAPGQTPDLGLAPRAKYEAPGRVGIGGEAVVTFHTPGPYASVEERAMRATEALNNGLENARSRRRGRFDPGSVWLAQAKGNPVIVVGKAAVITVTPEDAQEKNTTQQALAQVQMRQIRNALVKMYGGR